MAAFKAGQNARCIVRRAIPGGYEVIVDSTLVYGSITTTAEIAPGTVILAKFICMHKGRALLSPISREDPPSQSP